MPKQVTITLSDAAWEAIPVVAAKLETTELSEIVEILLLGQAFEAVASGTTEITISDDVQKHVTEMLNPNVSLNVELNKKVMRDITPALTELELFDKLAARFPDNVNILRVNEQVEHPLLWKRALAIVFTSTGGDLSADGKWTLIEKTYQLLSRHK